MTRATFSRCAAMFAVLLATVWTASPAPTHAQDGCPSAGQYAAVESQFLGILNAARAQEGAGPLSLHPLLTQAATAHSVDMATQQYFSHTGQDGSSPGQRTARIGYADGTIAENIAVNSSANAQAVFDQWLNSPGHRRNMMNPEYNLMGLGMGCGTFKGFPNYTYYTQVLGKDGNATGGNTGGNAGNTGGDTGSGGGTGSDTGGDTGGNTGGDGSDTGGDTGGDTGEESGDTGGDTGGESTEETGNTGNAFASKSRGTAESGPVLTATGDPLTFGEVLTLTLPAGWLYSERTADSEVDIANAEVSVYGYVGYYGGSVSGVTPETDLVALTAEWAEGAGGTVISPATGFTTDAGLSGASAVVEIDGEHVYLFLVFNPSPDWIVYGELYGAPDEIAGNTDLSAIVSTLGLTEG